MENNIKFSILLSKRAERDLNESFRWYEEKQKGLGSRFIDEVLNRIGIIETNPELFAIKCKSYRESSLEKFPYIIIYRINNRKNQIRIVGVFHMSRNPVSKY